ncbi:MAG TPA: type VI secretion system protein TssA [Pyrinomonadaceae bacterium]|nr:type VI secretion system protein TssA [Pyrinomonadaceae bacterium]
MSAETIPERIDLEKLSSPISEERPAGEYLRYEGTYDRIREARREDDPTLSQGIYKTELKRADWRAVANICMEALETRTKDLQIGAWLMEAWLRLYGFAGCRDGLQLLRELMERFWEHVHPQLNEGDPEDRIHSFVWINEKLSMQLKLIPLTAPQAGDLVACSFADWEIACRLEQLGQRDPKELQAAEASGQVTLVRFQTSAGLTDTHFFMELSEELSGALTACLAVDELLEEKFGRNSPGLERFKETLGAIQHLVADILHARPEAPYLSSAPEQEMVPVDEGHEPGREIWSANPIRSRAEAYWRLTEAAEYLLRTEPHSPTPYLVKRAVEWGSMSLFEVFQQIIRNEGEMQEINRLLRLTNQEEGGRAPEM